MEVVGRGLTAKGGKEKELKVAPPLLAPAIKRCDDDLKQSNPQLVPLLPAKSKIRVPLRFFPNGDPITEKRKLGARLIISVNELGIRRVSRDFKEGGVAREKWVSKVNVVKHKDVGQNNKAQENVDLVGPSVVGLSTYEVGEGSGLVKYGPCEGPKVGLGSVQDHSPQTHVKANNLSRVVLQPDKVQPDKVRQTQDLSCAVAVIPEKKMRLEYSHGAIVNCTTWFIQLADDCRLALSECPISRWPPGFGLGVSQRKVGSREYDDEEGKVENGGAEEVCSGTEMVKVKDSWRVVNHRDIIPTVPRLMGYCHVAQPVYLAAGDLRDTLENMELSGDGYQVDVLGESTPDVLVIEFMKGEKELIENILQTEINIFRSIRDGSALMQHMEDFYYTSLLEHVRSNTVASSRSEQDDSFSIG
ncbi:putative feruloyl esterase a [Fagus crenata]